MASHSSFFESILSHAGRDQLLADCPALQLLCYQHVIAALMSAGGRVEDPLASRRKLSSEQQQQQSTDGVGEMLAMASPSEVLGRVYAAAKPETNPRSSSFWQSLRATLTAAWTPPALPGEDATACREATRLLSSIQKKTHFLFPQDTPGLPLLSGSLRNAMDSSKRVLRSVSTCALSGSTTALKEKSQQALGSVVQLARLVPPTHAEGQVTSEGLSFCMMSLQQQWWALVCGALDRIMALTQHQADRISLPLLWQLMAVLSVLDTTSYMYAFPSKEDDPAGYHLVARLSEVGLTYLVRTSEGQACFVVSPHFQHALEWQATTPMCASSMLSAGDGASVVVAGCRREDTDTIITETNFRLYAYTRNEDLLSILDQFATREERVDDVLVCFRLTRDSFVAALRKGISAAQILKFLSLRAHPSMLRKYGEDAHANVSAAAAAQQPGSGSLGAPSFRIGGGVLSATSTVPTHTLAIPQSVCDQLFMWESECNRVVFTKQVVLLRNMSSEQQHSLLTFFQEMGVAEAIVYREPGYMVVREDVYDRFLADSVEKADDSPTR